MPGRAKAGPHRAAVTKMLRATGLLRMPEEAPLVELVKVLADEMDEGGGARTRADYLSALKDVRRVTERPRSRDTGRQRPSAESAGGGESAEASEAKPARKNDLADFKERRGIA